MKQIEYYTTSEGKCPYTEWRDGLSVQYKVRIAKRLKRMQEGNYGDWKRLQNSQLSELRFDFGAGYQIYFYERDNTIILVLSSSDKSDQNRVIKKADDYLEDYLNRSIKNDNKF